MTLPRIAFAGTPEFAVPALRAVVAYRAAVPFVLTQPDRPAGRGRRVLQSPVKQTALALGLPVAQPTTLRSPDLPGQLGAPPDLLVVVAYGLLLPAAWLEWPLRGCVNLHASLLPRWRGAAPIQRALLAGDTTTGVSLMRMERGLDTGPVYAARSIPIDQRETAGQLHDRLATLGASLLAETLPDLLAGQRAAVPQAEELATLAPKIEKSEALVDWRRSAAELERQVRAFDPWPVAESSLSDGRRLRIFAAEVREPGGRAADPGTIVGTGAFGIDVAAGVGVLRLRRVQPPSGRVMDAAAYLAAHSLAGARFVP